MTHTPARQPQHCDHKQICYHVWNNVGHGCPYDNDNQNPEKKTCKHDTRSRQRPAPAHKKRVQSIDRNAEGNLTMTFDYDQLTEHDTAISRQAREEVLDSAIEKFGEWYDAGFARPVKKEHVTKILESLRQHDKEKQE